MREILQSLLRGTLFLLALAVIAVAVGGGVWYLTNAPEERTTQVVDAGNLLRAAERSWFGLILWLRADVVENPADPQNHSLVTFIIEPGEAATTISDRLEKYGLITDATTFRYLLRTLGADTSLQAGYYYLRRSMTMDEMAERLQHGWDQTAKVTIPEGLRVEEIAERLLTASESGNEIRLQVVKDEFYRLVETGGALNYAFLRDRPPSASSSLQGYLFPDTYQFPENADAGRVIDIMLGNFDARVTPELRSQAVAQGKSLHEVVTLASIVQREVRQEEELPIVASVYLNRLAVGMNLQADPTVQYAKGKDPEGKWWGHMLQEEAYTAESPYNTFLNPGLPPGPICSPGLAAIQAVLNPAQTNYLFFFAKGDGTHAFAVTYEEHLENQRQYREGLPADDGG